jgi:hypothetical protein
MKKPNKKNQENMCSSPFSLYIDSNYYCFERRVSQPTNIVYIYFYLIDYLSFAFVNITMSRGGAMCGLGRAAAAPKFSFLIGI